MKIAVVSQSRSDYGIYLPLLKAIPKEELTIILAGMHFEYKHGDTFKIVEREFPNQCLANPYELNYDWIIVLGDTWPMLEYASRAVKQNTPVAHIHGGDVTGSIDDSIRHAITRFAHLHFPSIQDHADRLLKMGEESWRITPAGPLGIYALKDIQLYPDIRVSLGLNEKPIILIIQNPVSTESKQADQQMLETLDAVNIPDWQPVIIYPNSDPGSFETIKVIKLSAFKSFANLPYLQFLSLLKESAVIVGNSSCGIVEAPSFKVRCVNIGSRQNGRTQGGNVINVPEFKSDSIRTAIYHSLHFEWVEDNPYLGYADGPEIILNKIRNTPIDKKLLEKKLTY